MTTDELSQLNPGIRATVEWLNRHGFQTTDSGDGETHEFTCDLPYPYVHITVPARFLVSEIDRLVELLRGRGVVVQPMDEDCSVPCLQGTYDPADGVGGVISLFNVKL